MGLFDEIFGVMIGLVMGNTVLNSEMSYFGRLSSLLIILLNLILVITSSRKEKAKERFFGYMITMIGLFLFGPGIAIFLPDNSLVSIIDDIAFPLTLSFTFWIIATELVKRFDLLGSDERL